MASPSVFISYASADGPIAQRVCELLEGRGISCWIAPRNVEAGADYGQAIIEGIKKSRIMLVLLSAESGASRYVAREVERAVTHHVTLLPVRLAPMDIPAQLEFFLGSCQWFDLFPPAPAQQLDKLADAVSRLLANAEEGGSAPVKFTPVANPQRPGRAWLIAAGLTIAVVSGVAFWMLRQPNRFVPPPSAGPLNSPLSHEAADLTCGQVELGLSRDGFHFEITVPEISLGRKQDGPVG